MLGGVVKALDWFLLIISVPTLIAGIISHLHTWGHPLYNTGLVKPGTSTKTTFIALLIILFVVWRVGG
jgi:hypothetical protein